LVALGAAVLLLALPALSAASDTRPADARAATAHRGGPLAHEAVVIGPLATTILGKLASGAASKAGGHVFGWLLGAFGLQSQLESQVGEILSKLEQIEDRLAALEESTAKLRTELAQGTFSGLVGQVTPLIANINKGMSDLAFIANLPANDPGKRALTEETLKFIHDHLLHKQEELALRIKPPSGADGLIVAASKAAKAHTRYWTTSTSRGVQDVFDYYQDMEARLLLLRVEYMHAFPDRFPGSYVKKQIADVEGFLADQKSELKPSPPPETIADTHTNLDWWWGVAFAAAPYYLWAHEAYPVGLTKEGLVPLLDGKPDPAGRRLPVPAELGRFLDGRPNNSNWAVWLRDKEGVPLPDPLPYGWDGVYVYNFQLEPSYIGPKNAAQVLLANGNFWLEPPYRHLGALVVEQRQHAYWW
jgi:hypothetical protein